VKVKRVDEEVQDLKPAAPKKVVHGEIKPRVADSCDFDSLDKLQTSEEASDGKFGVGHFDIQIPDAQAGPLLDAKSIPVTKKRMLDSEVPVRLSKKQCPPHWYLAEARRVVAAVPRGLHWKVYRIAKYHLRNYLWPKECHKHGDVWKFKDKTQQKWEELSADEKTLWLAGAFRGVPYKVPEDDSCSWFQDYLRNMSDRGGKGPCGMLMTWNGDWGQQYVETIRNGSNLPIDEATLEKDCVRLSWCVSVFDSGSVFWNNVP